MATSVGELAINVITNFATVTTEFGKMADGINRSAKNIESQMESMGKVFGRVIGLIGGGVAVGFAKHLVADSIEAIASLKDLSTQTGATIESLSAVRAAALISGTSMQEAGVGMQRLAKASIEAQSGSGKAAAALQSLGLNAKTFATEFRSTDQQLMAVAKSFAALADGPQKTAIAMDLLGKSGAQLLPFMEDLVEHGLSTVRISREQVLAADQLSDSWAMLRARISDLGVNLANVLVPALQKMLDNLAQLGKIAGLVIAAFVSYKVIPAIFTAAALAVTAYKEAVIGAVLAEELLGIKAQKGLAGMIASLKTAAGAMAALQAAAVLAIAAFAGWEIGSFLEKNFLQAKLAGIAFVAGTLKGWEDLKLNFGIAVEAIKYLWAQALENMRVTLGAFTTAAGRGLSAIPGLEGLGAQIEALGKSLTNVSGNALGTFKARVAELAAENTKAKAAITSTTDDMVAYAIEAKNAAKATANLNANAPKSLKFTNTEGLKEFAKAMQGFRQMTAEANGQLNELLDGRKFTAAQKAFEAIKTSDVWRTFNAGQKQAIENAAKLADAAQRNVDIQKLGLAVLKDLDAIGGDYNADFIEKQDALNELLKAGVISLERYEAASAKLLAQQPFAKREAEAMQELIKAEQVAIDLLEKMQQQATETLGSYAEQNDRIEQETKLLGLTEDARARALVLMDAQVARQALINAGDVKGLELLDEQIARRQVLVTKQLEIAKAVSEQQQVFRDLADAGADFIEDFVQNGSKAFKNLWENFKRWALAALARIAAQKIVVQIAGTFGGNTGNIASQVLGGGSSGFGDLLGNVAGSAAGTILESIFGGIGSASALGPIIPTFGTSLAAGILSPISTAATLFTQGLGAFGSTLAGLGAALGAAIPIIGIVAAVALAFSKDKGGPKSGGFAQTGVDTSIGDLVEGAAFRRFYTPSDADETVKGIVDSVAKTYADVVRSFGIDAREAVFALGFDTDPEGTAGSRIGVGATVGGQNIYSQENIDVGRDDGALQERLALEAQRALLAALQASQFPQYLADILDSVDVAGASAQQIQEIIATAQALKTAVDTVSGLGEQFANLEPEQIKELISAFGGLEGFASAFQFLDANFTTDADKLARATATLNSAFASLGVQVPQTHAEFLDLLSGLDLADAAGQELYASLVSLAPLFTQVAGTAQQAAEAERQLADARAAAIADAEDLFADNFFSDAEKQAQAQAAAMQQINAAQRELGITIPTTVTGFRELVLSLRDGDEAQRALYESVIQLAPAVLDLAGAMTNAAQQFGEALGIFGTGDLIASGQEMAEKIESQINTALQGMDFGSGLAKRVSLLGSELNRLLKAQANQGGSFKDLKLEAAINALRGANQAATAELAQFTLLTAQYDAERAAQLVQLQKSFNEAQFALIGSGPEVLAALSEQFNIRWQEIINGVSGGVDGSLSQLERLRQGIASYLDGLRVGALSPLKPGERLAEAERQFEEQFAKAQAGDLDALGDITKYADQLLQIGRELFASGEPFSDLFEDVTSKLETLTGTGVSAADAASLSANRALEAALPTNGQLASGSDVAGVRSELQDVREAVAALADVIDGNAQRSIQTTERLAKMRPVIRGA